MIYSIQWYITSSINSMKRVKNAINPLGMFLLFDTQQIESDTLIHLLIFIDIPHVEIPYSMIHWCWIFPTATCGMPLFLHFQNVKHQCITSIFLECQQRYWHNLVKWYRMSIHKHLRNQHFTACFFYSVQYDTFMIRWCLRLPASTS